MLTEKFIDVEKRPYHTGSGRARLHHSKDKFLNAVNYCFVLNRKDPSAQWLEISSLDERKFGGAPAWEVLEENFSLTATEEKDHLEHIVEAIAVSKSTLELKNDWDGEESSGYSQTTWDRMQKFLIDHARAMWNQIGISIPAPQILPGPDGSIDMLWKTDDYELLVNIPSDPMSFVSFYGDDRDRSTVRGTIDPARTNQGILSWLMTHS